MKNEKINLEAFNRMKDLHIVNNLKMTMFPSAQKLDIIKCNTNFDQTKIQSLKNHYKTCCNILKQIYNENKVWFNKNKDKLSLEKQREYENILNAVNKIV